MPEAVKADIILSRIEKWFEDKQESGLRSHLGGSLIGRKCMRELWYSFRWASGASQHKGRLLRLFDRGHLEEFRMVEWLRGIGCDVREHSQRLIWEAEKEDGGEPYSLVDWDDARPAMSQTVNGDPYHVARAEECYSVKAEQWRILDVAGHFGGSLDGIAYNVPGVEQFGLGPEDPVLLEFKTHGQKSFDSVVKNGLEAAKAEHVAQMQIYMLKRGIKLALYLPICKNTDEIYPLFLQADTEQGVGMLSKARDVICSPVPFPRISANPGWFECRFCDHRGTCHLGKPLAKSCRTCVNANIAEDGEWHCALWDSMIPREAQEAGCDSYTPIDTA